MEKGNRREPPLVMQMIETKRKKIPTKAAGKF
jgi:hypothetical protein